MFREAETAIVAERETASGASERMNGDDGDGGNYDGDDGGSVGSSSCEGGTAAGTETYHKPAKKKAVRGQHAHDCG